MKKTEPANPGLPGKWLLNGAGDGMVVAVD